MLLFRRCGKSVVLRQIIDEIKEKGVREDHIIYMNIESKEYSDIRNDDELYAYIKSKMIDQDKYYIFLDEIHKVTKWELAVNSFKADYGDKVSLFVTRPNSDL